MSHHGYSSQGTQQAHESSSQQPSHPEPSDSQQDPYEIPRNWEWTLKGDGKINLTTNEFLEEQANAFHHQDFQLSRAWLCFGQENIVGDHGTNHAFLKFDFKDCSNHIWRSVKLEAKEPEELEDMIDETTNENYTPAEVLLSLKKWDGPSRSLKFCVELGTNFSSSGSHGTTLGNLIELLARKGLCRFGFSEITADNGDELYVGCRDYV